MPFFSSLAAWKILNSVKQFLIRIHKVNVVEQTELAGEHSIRSVPVLLLYKNGTEVWRMNGFKPAAELEETIRNFQ